MKKSVENLAKRKQTGGRRRALRGRRKYEIDRYPAEPLMGSSQVIVRRVRGHDVKFGVKTVEFANVVEPGSRKVSKAKITKVTKNPSNKDYERRGVITRGAIIETEAGTARVLSRPGQDGVVNAVLVKQ
ncbi:MAG: 30S ribosomal protein S8e [Nitrososphaerales archaeon]